MAKTDLYRHFDKDGRLLYVGISKCAWGRFAKHRDESYWAASSAKMTIESFPTRNAALAAERRAIAIEKPLCNITHNRSATARWIAGNDPPASKRPSRRRRSGMYRYLHDRVEMPWPNPFLVK